MSRLVRLIGSGIGLASEAYDKRKSSSQVPTQASVASSSSRAAPQWDDSPPQYVELPDEHAAQLIASGKAVPAGSQSEKKSAHEENDEDDDSLSEDSDEEHWELDEALETVRSSHDDREVNLTEAQIADEFTRNHPPPAYTPISPKGKLAYPVIIPQRRPRNKKRGFVRAYAPALADCGVDQAAFLDFLESFDSSSKASPWLQVINIAAMGAGFVPSPIAMGVATAVQVCVGVAMELQARTRSNSFLDQINREYFQPRGLFCLIMTYKPDSSATHETVDITKTIHKSMNPSTGMAGQLGKLKVSSGKTYGELEMPEAAPLIFPDLDRIAADNSAEGIKKQNKLKSTQDFVADYFDKRARAQYAQENPQASLAVNNAGSSFTSRYADPNHPASSGSLVALITGGAVNPRARKQERRDARRAHRDERRIRRGREPRGPRRSRRNGNREGVIRKMLKHDVLYLMVVNLPTEEEMEGARRALDQEEAQKQGYGSRS
ncbi:hypothetical protein BP6252_08075 [Coleophoma cylindrospora]|uniref:Uncharacterized protein n=1 Tax=Coleophoma cylindrospora TaxID=1849047 RepID=A0A3D8RBU8_9HELO|nr:hypothetical protein BP6252_08075 [Coleophoma cylindrospora]